MVNTSSGWPTSGSYLRGYALGEGKTEASNLSLDWLEPDAANLGAPQGVIPNPVGGDRVREFDYEQRTTV